ncbi:MAG: 50S ribosomal protein L35 [Alphaproteobacteria bacterium PRO2]|jgi:large subunit ribosomal protein L35|nr:50S ribosomal protein L35 [Alphaproteobacteria bacterium PRO2]
MPKMKTVSGAKKRFKVTAKGRVKFKQAKARHMQMNKPKKMKRKARGTDVMIPGDERLVTRYYLPNDRVRRRRVDSRKLEAAKTAKTKGAK